MSFAKMPSALKPMILSTMKFGKHLHWKNGIQKMPSALKLVALGLAHWLA
jgi:hypothetical protein